MLGSGGRADAAWSRRVRVPGFVDGGDDAFLHFDHLFLHAVFKDCHVVDEVLAGGCTVEEVLGEPYVFWGSPFFV